ncbi:hypothetical protein Aboo_1431 [Aciduliprofundum boonei T469]|uniref:Uncharacterized protein n=2 Tax=Candidatus Aciduliprofundum boonei TaxID=379547 RepID=D3TAV9_ACIB4|nr:hypothetical protein Aboo_1431 [Aciduliprofundum boonei T469]
MMKRLVVVGIMLLLLINVGASVTYAQSDSNKWGYKLNINLQNEFQPYLKVLTDMMVTNYNKMNQSYQISSYDVGLNGNVKMAGAMKKDGANMLFDTGSSTNANLSFYFNGTFPYSNNVTNFINNNFEPRNMNISAKTNIIQTAISNGTAFTDGKGNVSKIISKNTNFAKVHIKGKNLPIPAMLYAALNEKYTKIDYVNITWKASFLSNISTPSDLYFSVELNEEINNKKVNLIKISDISLYDENLSLSIKDVNHNGLLDTGDIIGIHGNLSYIQHLIEHDKSVVLHIPFEYKGHIIYVEPDFSYFFGQWWSSSVSISTIVQSIPTQYMGIIDQFSNMSPYDNFDFTIETEYNRNATISFSPALPLMPTSKHNLTMSINGNYSGVIKIIGLQEKYIKMLELLLNKTFTINGNVAEYFFNGNFSKSKNISSPTLHISGEMQYGGENVYVVQIMNTNDTWNPSQIHNFHFYYFYSKSKGFIVGGGINLGIKKFDTEPTTYENAMNEIKSIQKEEKSESNNPSNSAGPSWLIPLSIGIIIIVIIAVIAIAFTKRKGK